MFPPSVHHHHRNISKLQSYLEGGGGGGGGFVGGGASSCYSSSSEGILGLMSRLEGGYDCSSEAPYCLGRSTTTDLGFITTPITIMAEDESRNETASSSTSKDNNNLIVIQDQETKNNNNNNNNNDGDDEDWLQLSIGGRSTNQENQERQRHHQGDELVELSLLPGNSSSSAEERGSLLIERYSHPVVEVVAATREPQMRSRPRPPLAHYGYDTSLFLQQHQVGVRPQSHHPHQEINWVYRPINFPRPPPLGIGSSSSSPFPSSSFIMQPGAYFSSARSPFQLFQPGPGSLPSMSSSGVDMNFRVINPPPRPHSGIWFMLQASQNQAKEPFLPQIPKSYLRIKDGRMTIRLVMKYLVNKLRLENESEVEVTCRGQQLVPFLTLQHVRDNIWNQRNNINNNNNHNVAITISTTLLPESPTTDHIMVLHYARSAI